MMGAAGRPVRAFAGALLLPLIASCAETPPSPEPGVPVDLADRRARTISDLAYHFRLDLPRDPDAPIHGSAVIDFTWTDPDGHPVVMDLEWAEARVRQVRIDGLPVDWAAVADHLVIPPEALEPHGTNRLEVEFVSTGEAGLRRDADLVYSLFVPDRAHALLPLFDQPDLRGTVSWEIEAPLGWEVVTNAAVEERAPLATSERWRFSASRPISPYLMAFAAGSFEVVEGRRRGRSYRLLHLGLDAERVDRHVGAVFDLHARSLAWMESYTGLAYPFGKFDIVAVPDLPYGGLEHPGVVLYRERDLLPPGETGLAGERRRAEIVAHESAHMWFGNLVALAWLDDLWMKEVFAGHFATRVVEEMFPDDDHDLRFLFAHHPAAGGSALRDDGGPIRGVVTNLHEGPVARLGRLHRRAPVALANLERLVSPATFRAGVRALLERHAWGSAGWDDFLDVLQSFHDGDLSRWSRTWVESSERPVMRLVWEADGQGRGTVAIVQEEGVGADAPWPQRLTVHGQWADRTESSTVEFEGDARRVVVWTDVERPDVVIPNASGLEYGRFLLDSGWTDALLSRLGSLRPALLRASAILVIEDAVPHSRVSATAVIESALSALEHEQDELLATRLVDLIGSTYNDHLAAERHHPLGDRIRAAFGDRIATARSRAQHARVASIWRRTILENRMPDGPTVGIEPRTSALHRASMAGAWRGGGGATLERRDLRDPGLRSAVPVAGGRVTGLWGTGRLGRVDVRGSEVGSSVAVAIDLPVVRLRPR